MQAIYGPQRFKNMVINTWVQSGRANVQVNGMVDTVKESLFDVSLIDTLPVCSRQSKKKIIVATRQDSTVNLEFEIISTPTLAITKDDEARFGLTSALRKV